MNTFIRVECLIIIFISTASATIAQISFGCDGTSATSSNSLCIKPDPVCIGKSYPIEGLNDSTIADYIVSQHNIRRARVASGGETLGRLGPQPPSKCMAKLSWDNDLAKAAQNWADQCKLSGDRSRNKFNVSDPYVGQNLYAFVDPSGTGYDPKKYPMKEYWDQAIASWYKEVRRHNPARIPSYVYNSGVGHYTQMVWGSTTKIGCGFRRWALPDGTGRFVRFLVCNYWPGGNRVGQKVYSTEMKGEYCSAQCANEPSSVLDGVLCA